MKTLVLGLGNPLISDDSVGLRVADALRPRLAARPEIEVGEDVRGGLRLMERMEGFERVIVIDAIVSGVRRERSIACGPRMCPRSGVRRPTM